MSVVAVTKFSMLRITSYDPKSNMPKLMISMSQSSINYSLETVDE